MDIGKYSPKSGRAICEDNTIVNEADLLKEITVAVANYDKVIVAVIPAGSQATPEIDISGYRLAAIEMPGAWDSAPLAFTATSVAGGTHTPVYESGIEVYEPAAASRTIVIASNALALAGLKYIKICSGKITDGRVTQTAARTFSITLKR